MERISKVPSYATIYDDSFGKVDFDFDFFRNFLKDKKSLNVLEVGAGGGRFVRLYREFSQHNYFLLEMDNEMLNHLEKKITKEDQNVKILNSFSQSIPLNDSSVDLILVPFAGITEMSPLMFTIGEFSRVLKDDGVLILTAMNPKKSSTRALGLERASIMKSKYGFSAENMPVPSKGKDFFEVHFEYRNKNFIQKNIIEQVHPSLDSWTRLLNHLGFKINQVWGDFSNSAFDEGASSFINLKVTKTDQFPISFENSRVAQIVYDNMADNYKNVSSSNIYPARRWLADKFQVYRDLFPVVLDIGTATGTLGEVLKESGVVPSFLYGLDLSDEMIKRCRAAGNYTSVIRWDMARGLLENKYFLYDIVTSVGVFEFIENLNIVLKSIYDSLKIGGIFLFTVEAKTSDKSEQFFDLPSGKFVRYAREESHLKDILTKAGFLLEEMEKGVGYVSPRTGEEVNYFYCKARRVK